ncbi:MAG: molecular chaperone TorD family protein [Clostridia bacterium]|nr:molecular chaperone TorD family protein [Clostridia bacterium]MBR6561787.1 molecular chaperone TorD family protein [Oscillospiraceae bacterium]
MIPQETKETFEAVLTNRVLLYKFFHKTFGREPDAAYMALFDNDAISQAFMLLSVSEEDACGKAAAFLTAQRGKNADPDYLPQLRNEYMRLFVGPQKLVAPPWESVYRSHQGLLFQESTLTVREIYRRQGFEAEGYPRVPDDSLSLEMDFMGRMAERALTALLEDRSDDLREALTVSESFLRVHLLFWVPKMLERLNGSAFRLFYPQMTKILLSFMELDLELVQEMLRAEL